MIFAAGGISAPDRPVRCGKDGNADRPGQARISSHLVRDGAFCNASLKGLCSSEYLLSAAMEVTRSSGVQIDLICVTRPVNAEEFE